MSTPYVSLAGEPGQHSALSRFPRRSPKSSSLDPPRLADIGKDAPRPAETKGIALHHACLRIKARSPSFTFILPTFADLLPRPLTEPGSLAQVLQGGPRHAHSLHLQRRMLLDLVSLIFRFF
jgi:hypothetical protein